MSLRSGMAVALTTAHTKGRVHAERTGPIRTGARRSSPNAREPRTEDLGRRDFANDSYGATEREQTRDLRLTDPGEPSDSAEDDANADIANDENGE